MALIESQPGEYPVPQVAENSAVQREPALAFRADTLAGDWLPAAVFGQSSAAQRDDMPLASFALADGRWKLLHEPEGGDRLYDWTTDPHERNDLAAERAEIVESMRTQLIERTSVSIP